MPYQHAGYELQLEANARSPETLGRGKDRCAGGDRDVSGEPWDIAIAPVHRSGSAVGISRRTPKAMFDTHCPISSPRVNEALAAAAPDDRDARWRGSSLGGVFTNEAETQLT